MKETIDNNTEKKSDGIGVVLFVIYLLFLLMSVVIIGRIIYIQLFYQPKEIFMEAFTPSSRKVLIEPERGAILSSDGRLLAASTPRYQIAMDCTVQKKANLQNKDRDKGIENEKKWMDKARKLSVGLAAVYKDKTADEYYRMIATARRSNRQYMKIGGLITHEQLLELKKYPLVNESSYRGGVMVEKFDNRTYPYGSLARRVLGHLDDNTPDNDEVGIEGKYDYALHGTDGVEWLRKTDNHQYIRDFDSTYVKVKDGNDVRTTLDIEIQDIAEKALKRGIEHQANVEGGCAIVMEVKTGAIRAMVNLTVGEDGTAKEMYNYAIGRAEAPGSVFKTATLMTLLEDKKVTLQTEVPTFRGQWTYNGVRLPVDPYLKEWKSDRISVKDGMKISSNQVFRYLVCTNYDENPKRFINKLYEYKLAEPFDFDLIGLAKTEIPMPGDYNWSGTTLPTISYGYSIRETPLHIVMFYNAIANKGKLMKPYLVESIEKDGKVLKSIKPEVLSGSICSRSTADTLAKVLRAVVTDGTARKLKTAKCPVAGKTGTARILVNFERNGRNVSAYEDDKGQKRHQGTFVGFFPADDPEYTAIVVVYSKLSKMNFYGGNIPANALKEIVNSICSFSPEWKEKLPRTESVPKMKIQDMTTGADNLDIIPNVKGLGLKDAMYSIENCGYRCRYEGYGHVVSQSPPAGRQAKKGTEVYFRLK